MNEIDAARALTLFEFGAGALARFCDAAGFASDKSKIADVYAVLGGSWRDVPKDAAPKWSALTDDSTPLELSLSIERDGPVDLRITSEAQAEPPSPASYWSAAWRVNELLEICFGADLRRARMLEDLFRPSDQGVAFALWHGVSITREGSPLFKLYFSPSAKGRERVHAVCEEAFRRIGLHPAWRELARGLGASAVPVFFSIDLVDPTRARVKLYVLYVDPTAEVLEAAGRVATTWVPGDAMRLARALAGSENAKLKWPCLVGYHVGSEGSAPERATVYMKPSAYADSDAAVRERVLFLLEELDLPSSRYERCLRALCDGVLSKESRIHTFVSLQRSGKAPRVTVYFNPRAFLSRYGAHPGDRRPWQPPVHAQGQ